MGVNEKMLPNHNYLIIVKPNDHVIAFEELTSVPEANRLNEIIGGYFEMVPFLTKFMGRKCVAFSDTDGKQKRLPFNIIAQEIWQESVGRPITNDYLCGTIVIIVGSTSFLSLL
jgi:hypothetical protein